MPSILRTATHGRRELLVIVAVCLAVTAVIWLLTLERISYERTNAVDDAVRQNTNLALAFEEQTLGAIKRADQALVYLKRQYEREGRVADLKELVAEGSFDDAFVPNRMITDAGGNVLDEHGRAGAVNIADRDFFEFHRRGPGGGLRIAKPLVGRVTGKALISVSRPLIDFDGNFGGVVALGLDPSYFTESYKKFDVGRDGLIQLVGTDGTVRARRNGKSLTYGEDMRESTLLLRAAASPAGSFVARGRLDGTPRFQSYRVLKGYPLVVAVGTSVDESLAQFHASERRHYLSAVAATLTLLVLAAGLVFATMRHNRAVHALASSEALYRAAFEQAAVGVTHCARDGRFLKVNAKYSQILGYSEDELRQRKFHEIIHPEDVAAAEVLRKQLVDAGSSATPLVHRELAKDGRVIWTSVAVTLVRDADGKPGYFVAVIEDITARKEAEAQLLEQLDELRRFQKVTVDRELRMVELEEKLRTHEEEKVA